MLKRRSAWFLFGLAFIAVYREVFETILFFAAIWNQGNSGAVLAGGAGAVLALVMVVAAVMLRYGCVLPIGKFFAYSSVLIALLAVVLTGKGVTTLEEAGYLPIHPMAGFPRIEMLGIFPTGEGIIAQLAMVLFLPIGFGYNHRNAQRIVPPTK